MRFYYYVDDARGFASFQKHARDIDVLAPQSFWIDSGGSVHGALPPRIQPVIRENRLRVMPLVFNRAFNRATVHSVLRNASARRRAVIDVARIARLDSVTGVQIDFENIDPADRRLYSRFVHKLAVALHREHRLLSAALAPRFSEPHSSTHGISKPGAKSLATWAAAYDYHELGREADFVTVMAYDHSGRNDPPGPIAGLSWVNRALAYATSRISSRKILLGIPLYGREWIDAAGKYDAQSVSFLNVNQILTRYHLEPRWNAQWNEPWVQYRAGGALCTIYYEDRRSLSGELNLVSQYHLRGYAAWRLGDEDPGFWTVSEISARR
ncbi:MAG: glycosyl hydrolase family 18 protein [Terriglobia bacterium]